MITLKGKYNKASIKIGDVDATTQAQILTFLDQPTFAGTNIAIMPDCHAGAGACIGFTMNLDKYVIPNIIGVDIGCGMLSYNFGRIAIDFPSLDRFINKYIPAGFNVHDTMRHIDAYNSEWIKRTCNIIDIGKQRVFQSLGTLGGGNHFIEVGRDSHGDVWVTVHSGSRNFGLKIAQYFQAQASKLPQAANTPKGLEAIPMGTALASQYIECLAVAQNYASLNRKIMLGTIMDFLGCPIKNDIESVHNYIDTDDNIIRKGATPARKGQKLLIPFNMRDGIAICEGLGNDEWNQSAPHGAGRLMSRTQAKKELNLELFKRSMDDAGIYTTSVNKSTLDEAPGAYKARSVILNCIAPTARYIDLINPIYNFKA